MRRNRCTFALLPVDVSRKQIKVRTNEMLCLLMQLMHISSLYPSIFAAIRPMPQSGSHHPRPRNASRFTKPGNSRSHQVCNTLRTHTQRCTNIHTSAACRLQNPSYLSLTFRAALLTTSCIFFTSIPFHESLQKGGNDFINLPQFWTTHWSNAILAALKIKSRGAGFSLKWMEVCTDPHRFSTTYPVLLLTYATYLKLGRLYRKSVNPQSAVALLVLMAWSRETVFCHAFQSVNTT